MHRTLATLRALLFLAALAFATSNPSHAFQDFVYVDATLGDDANTGLSESDAFRTLTAATTAFPGDFKEFRVAPGLYDTAHGEVFPIEIRNGATIRYYPYPANRPGLVGEEAGDRPIIDAGGAPIGMRMGGEDDLAPWKGSYNMVIRNAQRGLVVQGVGGFYFGRSVIGFSFQNCEVGLDIIQDPIPSLTYLGFGSCSFERCRVGARMAGRTQVSISESRFQGIPGVGILVGDVHQLLAGGCSFLECGTGMHLDATASFSVANTNASLFKLLFAQCDRGLFLRESVPGRLTFEGDRLTFADNGIGIDTLASPSAAGFSSANVRGAIFAQNGEGVVTAQAGLFLSECLKFASGTINTFGFSPTVDPEFRDPSAGDYRLKPGSPAIDAYPRTGTAGVPFGTLDGDLNLELKEDFGAFEFAPLARIGTLRFQGRVPVGSTLDLEVAGEPGGPVLGILQAGFVSGSTTTPFGELFLDPSQLLRDVRFSIDPTTGFGHWPFAVPSDPALVGTRINVQALSASANAPAGSALTNVLTMTLIP